MTSFVSRPSASFLVIWLNRLLTAKSREDQEWLETQEKELRVYPKLIKDHHYFDLHPLSSLLSVHLESLLLLQDVLSLKVTKVIFDKICSSFRFNQLEELYHPKVKEMAYLLKQPLELVFETVFATIRRAAEGNEAFLTLSDQIYYWSFENTQIQQRIGLLSGNVIFQLALTLFLFPFISEEREDAFLLSQMTFIERSLRHLSPLNTAIVYKEFSKSSFCGSLSTFCKTIV